MFLNPTVYTGLAERCDLFVAPGQRIIGTIPHWHPDFGSRRLYRVAEEIPSRRSVKEFATLTDLFIFSLDCIIRRVIEPCERRFAAYPPPK
jgi:hypothetical protein